LVQYDEFKDIPGYTEWNIIKKIEKGWSQDAKYYVQNNNGEEHLLRISDISTC